MLFRLVIPATVVFIVTILALIATLFGDQRAPVSMWLDRNAGNLLAVELGTVIVLAVLAIAVDRHRLRQNPPANRTSSGSQNENRTDQPDSE